MKKRLIALAIVLVMILSFGLVACGEAGAKGEKGDKGDTGATGQTGATGAAGAAGADGADGKDGKDGSSPIVLGDSWAEANYGTAAMEIFEFNWAHQATIGYSRVTTTEEGEIDEIEFDEIFELSAWARIDKDSAARLEGVADATALDALATLNSTIRNEAKSTYWPLYISLGGNFYKAQLIASRSGVPNQSDTVSAAGTNVRYFPLTGSGALSTRTIDGAKSLDTLIAGRTDTSKDATTSWTPDNVLGKAFYDLAAATVANFDKTEGYNTAGLRAYKSTATAAGAVTTDFYYVTKGTNSETSLKTTFTRPDIFKLNSNYDWPSGNTDPTKGKVVTYAMLIDFVRTYGFDIKFDTFKAMVLGNPVMSPNAPKATWTVAVKDETSGVYFRLDTGATATDVPNYLITIARACERISKLVAAARINTSHGHVAVPASIEWNSETDAVTINNPLDIVGGTINGNTWTTDSNYNTTLTSIFSKLSSLSLTATQILAWDIQPLATGTAWINTALGTTGVATGGTESAINFLGSVLMAVQLAVEGKVTYATEIEAITVDTTTHTHLKLEEANGADETAGYDYVLTVENKNYNSGSVVDAYIEFDFDGGLPIKPTVAAAFQTSPTDTTAKTLTGVGVNSSGRLRISNNTDLSSETSVLCWKITLGEQTIYVKIVFASIA